MGSSRCLDLPPNHLPHNKYFLLLCHTTNVSSYPDPSTFTECDSILSQADTKPPRTSLGKASRSFLQSTTTNDVLLAMIGTCSLSSIVSNDVQRVVKNNSYVLHIHPGIRVSRRSNLHVFFAEMARPFKLSRRSFVVCAQPFNTLL